MAKDLFSAQASLYSKFRPSYPKELIDHIVALSPARCRLWDCATGNGQAATLFTPFYEQIFATDSSEKQLQNAVKSDKITYIVDTAEKTSFEDNFFDVITVAQAYHWFNFTEFFRECCRVGKNNTLVAVWGYDIPVCADPNVNEMIRHFYKEITGPYWDPERKYVDERYRSIPFYFQDLTRMEFESNVYWSAEDVLGYFSTWSAVQHFKKANGSDPVEQFRLAFMSKWPNLDMIEFSFSIFLLTGRIEK